MLFKMSGQKLVPTKFLLKKKDDIDGSVRFKSRCVALRFMIVPSVDFPNDLVQWRLMSL